MMDRRAVLGGLLALTMAPLSLAASGGVYCIGYLSMGDGTTELSRLLAELGWVEGKNLRFDVRIASAEQLERAVGNLLRSDVDALLVDNPSHVTAVAAATRKIPIVCAVPDPIGMGFAHALRRPGMNITGLSLGLPEAAEIRVAMLRAVRPRLERVTAIYPAGFQAPVAHRPHVSAAKAQGISWDFAAARELADVERTVASMRPASDAVYLAFPWPLGMPASEVAAIALRHRIASMGNPADGALMYYSQTHADPMRRIAAILDKVLRGANPAEIPFELPNRTIFEINRATAKAIGVSLPSDLLLRATRIIG